MSDKKTKVDRFRYESIVKSTWFTRVDQDLLKVLLDKEKEYSFDEIRKILDKEKKRTVK